MVIYALILLVRQFSGRMIMNITRSSHYYTSTEVFIRTELISFTVMPLVGGLGGLAHPEFGSSVNPIPTEGGRLCPTHYILIAHPDSKT